MLQGRKTSHRTWRCPLRKLTRASVRSLPGFCRGPDDLAQALTAFSRALRCHRRLARLAPRFFDSAVVDGEAREREEQRRWIARWESALNRVYGPAPATARNHDADLPPIPSPRTRRAVERELAGWSFWMSAGGLALKRHQQRRPHAVPDLTRLTRLLRIASAFGCYACGLPLDNCAPRMPEPASFYLEFEAALHKIYGNHDSCKPPASPSPAS